MGCGSTARAVAPPEIERSEAKKQEQASSREPTAKSAPAKAETEVAKVGDGKPPENQNKEAVAAATEKAVGSKAVEVSKPIETLSRAKLEEIVQKAPDRKTSNVAALCQHFKQFPLSDEDKAWVVYRWIALNINFDLPNSHVKATDPLDVELVMKTGKTVSAGYGKLYQHITQELGLKTECVAGWTKGFGFDPESPEATPPHEWNAVSLAGRWQLVDTMWGAGYADEDAFVKQYDESYFCPEPVRLLRTHFPQDPKWQLVPAAILRADFDKLAIQYPQFLKAGFRSATPDSSIVSTTGRVLLQLIYDPQVRPEVRGKVVRITEKGMEDVKNRVFVQKGGNCLDIEVALDKAGKYDLLIFGANRKENELPSRILKHRLICDGKSPMQAYPTQELPYWQLDCVLHSPREGDLQLGSEVKFRVASSKAAELFVVVGMKWIPMQMSAPGSFEASATIDVKDVHVYGKTKDMPKAVELLGYRVKINETLPVIETMELVIDEEVVAKNGLRDFPKNGLLMANDKNMLQFRMKFNEAAKTKFLGNLTDQDAGEYKNYALVQAENETVHIDVSLPTAGDYLLQLFTKHRSDSGGSFSRALEYVVRGTAETTCGTFVVTYPQFHEQGGFVYEPRLGTLAKTSKVSFRIRVRNCTEAILQSHQGKKFPLNKETNDLFTTATPLEIPKTDELILYGVLKGKTALQALLKYDVE